LSNVVAVAAATSFALALKGDGTVAAWGATAGTNVPATLTNVVGISAGDTYALAVRSDGTVVGWGGSSPGTNSSGVSNIVSTAGSPNHALGLRREGTLVEWGTSQSKAAIPLGLTRVTSFADGVGFGLASRADGSLVTWGGFNQSRVIDPTPPLPVTNAVSVAAGLGFAVVLKSDGHVFAWGNSGPAVTNVPLSLTNVAAIACNGFDQNPAYVLALRSNGLVSAWGSVSSLGPVNIPAGLSNVVAVAAGSAYTLALVSDDGLPVILREPVGGTAFSGNSFTLSAKVASATPLTYAWSLNGTNIPDATNASYVISKAQPSDVGSYQLIVSNLTGSTASFPVPVVVIDAAPTLLTFSTGTNRPYVGTAFSLGSAPIGSGPMQTQWRLNGQNVPDGTNADLVFSRLRGTNGGSYTFVASNSFGAVTSSVVLVMPVSIVGWGSSVYGTTNPPINLSNAVAVSLWGELAEALRADGTVATWGMQGSNVPPYISNVVEVANNSSAFFTLKSDGTVRGWNIGSAFSNSLAHASNVVSIEADTAGATLLNADGTVTRILSTGATNFYPQLTNVVAVIRDIESFAVLMADGTVTNFYGGTASIPPQSALTNVYDIALDISVGAVLRRDRAAQTWFPISGPNTNLFNIIGVSENVGIRSNGTVVLWNFNSNFPQLTNVPPRLANVISIEGSLRAELAVMGPRDFQPLLLPDALDTTALVVSSRGAPRWYAETNVTHDGLHAAQSAEIGNNTASSMRMWVAGPVAISFWWKVSSETNHDLLNFSAGGVVLTNISGETDWQQCSLQLPPGNQILQWTYSKDPSGSAGQDAGWVDQLVITPIAPWIITQPADANISGGSNVTFAFTVIATGTPPLRYQWSKDGTVLTNGPSPSYLIFNVTRTNSGIYSVVVTNVAGSATSSNATLVVRVPQLLSAPTFQPDGTITFSSADSDGSGLTSSDVSHLQVQASSNLVDWVTLPGALTLQGGMLQLQDSGATNAPLRYYRIVETW